MQIQYNITRIEEWCKSHEMPEGLLQLEHLMQATKLLQLKKVSLPLPSLCIDRDTIKRQASEIGHRYERGDGKDSRLTYRARSAISRSCSTSAGFSRQPRSKSSSRNITTPTMKRPSLPIFSKPSLRASRRTTRTTSCSWRQKRMRLGRINCPHQEILPGWRLVSSRSQHYRHTGPDSRYVGYVC